MSGELAGRTALIVGANGGIGSAIADELARAGAALVLAGRDLDRLTATARRLAARGSVVRALRVDVTDEASVEALADAIDVLDVAVNNVGTSHRPTSVDRLGMQDFDRVVAVTLRGTALAMRAELARMADGGAIVNIASTAGVAAAPGMAAYVAAKHGVIGLTRTAALDTAERRIRVNAVAPGSIDSGPISTMPARVKESASASAPLARLGTAHEVAGTVRWLVSPQAAYVTGSVVVIDGGRGAGGA